MITEEFYNKLGNFIDGFHDKRDEVKILNFVMGELGYIPPEVQEFIADRSGLFLTTIKNAVDFFPKYRESLEGATEIKICIGMGCKNRGSMLLLEKAKEILGINEGETTGDGRYRLLTQRCFGQCGKGPNVSVDGVLFSNLKEENLEKIIGRKDI